MKRAGCQEALEITQGSIERPARIENRDINRSIRNDPTKGAEFVPH